VSERFRYLFTPFQTGLIAVKDRLVFLPHAAGFVTPDGLPDEREYWYHRESAEGGVGLIIEGDNVVHRSSRGHDVANAFDAEGDSLESFHFFW